VHALPSAGRRDEGGGRGNKHDDAAARARRKRPADVAFVKDEPESPTKRPAGFIEKPEGGYIRPQMTAHQLQQLAERDAAASRAPVPPAGAFPGATAAGDPRCPIREVTAPTRHIGADWRVQPPVPSIPCPPTGPAPPADLASELAGFLG